MFALTLPVISAENIPNTFAKSLRNKQRIVKTACFALGGISLYIERHKEQIESITSIYQKYLYQFDLGENPPNPSEESIYTPDILDML